MSEQSEKLFDGVTRVGDDLIEAAQAGPDGRTQPGGTAQTRRKTRSVRVKWGAAAAAVLLIFSGIFALARGSGEPSAEPAPPAGTIQPADIPQQPQTAGLPYARFLAAGADYPAMAQYQDDSEAWQNERWERFQRQRELRADVSGCLDELVPRLLSGAEGENRVCSPLNVYMALAMAAELSDGGTRRQLLDLLDAADIDALRQTAAALWDLHYRDDGVSVSVLASSLWMRDDIDYKPETLQTLRDVFRASSFRGDMEDGAYQEALRGWLNEQTGGQLADFVESVTLDPRTVLELVTTVYFRAKWLSPFDAADTRPDVFHAAGGDVERDFMHAEKASIFLYTGERFTALRKGFEDAGGMWFLVPEEGLTPEDLLSDAEAMALLNGERYAEADLHWYWGKLSMPKLDIVSDLELSDTLKALGVTSLFDPDAADFSPLSGGAEGVSVSRVRHAARLTMDEDGVTATAFTDMGWGAGGPEDERDFTLDRPFLFRLSGNDYRGEPLFVGVVNEP